MTSPRSFQPAGGRRRRGDNPRARGTNPRALGTNPRAQAAYAEREGARITRQTARRDEFRAELERILLGRGHACMTCQSGTAPDCPTCEGLGQLRISLCPCRGTGWVEHKAAGDDRGHMVRRCPHGCPPAAVGRQTR